MADTAGSKISNLVFTNNLSTRTDYGFSGSGAGQGTPALTANFNSWTFSGNVIVNAPAASYPAGNFFPTTIAEVHFVNFAGGDYALSASSPYKSAATDGTAVGADLPAVPAGNMIAPSPPGNVVVR